MVWFWISPQFWVQFFALPIQKGPQSSRKKWLKHLELMSSRHFAHQLASRSTDPQILLKTKSLAFVLGDSGKGVLFPRENPQHHQNRKQREGFFFESRNLLIFLDPKSIQKLQLQVIFSAIHPSWNGWQVKKRQFFMWTMDFGKHPNWRKHFIACIFFLDSFWRLEELIRLRFQKWFSNHFQWFHWWSLREFSGRNSLRSAYIRYFQLDASPQNRFKGRKKEWWSKIFCTIAQWYMYKYCIYIPNNSAIPGLFTFWEKIHILHAWGLYKTLGYHSTQQ